MDSLVTMDRLYDSRSKRDCTRPVMKNKEQRLQESIELNAKKFNLTHGKGLRKKKKK